MRMHKKFPTLNVLGKQTYMCHDQYPKTVISARLMRKFGSSIKLLANRMSIL